MARFKLNWDWVIAIFLWFLGLIAFGMIYAERASATQPCNHFFKQQVIYAQPVYAAPIYYQAGANIENDALAEKITRKVVGQLRAELKSGMVQQQVASTERKVGPALFQHCSKCHSGAAPKAGLVYDGITSLACFQVTAALRSIAREEMPKDHKLTPELKGQIMQELLDLEQPADRMRPPEIPQPSPGVLQ